MNKCPKCGEKDIKNISGNIYKCNKCGYYWDMIIATKNLQLKKNVNNDDFNINKNSYNDNYNDNDSDNDNDNNNNINNINDIERGRKRCISIKTPKKDLSMHCCKLEKKFLAKAPDDKFLINIKFFDAETIVYYEKKDLSSLLNLCLMKYLSELLDDYDISNVSPEIIDIMIKLRNSLNFTKNKKNDIYNLLNEEKGYNILAYSEYVNTIINTKNINNIIKFLNDKKKSLVDNYWRNLSKYEEYNSFFEEELRFDLKKAKFDYSIISLGILEGRNIDEYNSKRSKCPNMEKRILYHGSQIDPISKILTSEFKYSRRPFYGMGIYFSDIIDYIAFYSGGTNFDNRRDNFGKIVPVNTTFSFIACEVFYDRTKFKQIKDLSLYVPDLDHFPTYSEIKEDYSDKMIEPNGIHFIRVDNDGNSLSENSYIKEKVVGEFLGNEYVITEKYQILPIYSITVKRNEYFVLWRDPNCKGKNDYANYLLERKLYFMEKAKMNIYFENSTEEALHFLHRRKYNKVIIITSIGLDLSGKKFIEVARKILGFNAMVLFFSSNEDHLKWIQKFPNCLYSNSAKIYEEYISNFNEKGLKNLKKKVEKEYNITLRPFSKDFLAYPNFKNMEYYYSLNFTSYSPYIRHLTIFCKNKNCYLYLDNNKSKTGTFQDYIWDATIVDDEITLCFDGNYLDVDEDNETIIGSQYMKIWKYKKTEKGQYYFIYPYKKFNNILSMEGNTLKINKSKPGKNEIFKLIDVLVGD